MYIFENFKIFNFQFIKFQIDINKNIYTLDVYLNLVMSLLYLLEKTKLVFRLTKKISYFMLQEAHLLFIFENY